MCLCVFASLGAAGLELACYWKLPINCSSDRFGVSERCAAFPYSNEAQFEARASAAARGGTRV